MSNESVIPDPIRAGLARGWKVIDGAREERDRDLSADVVVVGSGAGGGVTAEILALSGLSVIVVEEGALKSSRDFKMREADAYPTLYQESAARKTRFAPPRIERDRVRRVPQGVPVEYLADPRTGAE